MKNVFFEWQNGQHVDISDDEEIDPKEYRKILKSQNASMFKLQNYRDSKVYNNWLNQEKFLFEKNNNSKKKRSFRPSLHVKAAHVNAAK